MPVDLVNEKINFWNQKGNTLREKEFKKVKEVLQKAMDEASNEDIDIVRTYIATITVATRQRGQ